MILKTKIKQLFAPCLLTLLIAINSIQAAAQDRVVVIPLGSDVSAEQFNALVKKMEEQRVYGGVVLSDGSFENLGFFTSSRVSEGLYRVRVTPPVIQLNHGDPSIVVTSRGGHRVPAITSISKELIDNQILYVEFDVYLRAIAGNLADSEFSFHLQFAEQPPLF